MCRHTLASIGAFFTFDNLAEIVKSYLRSANVNKCSHNGSYHIPEEAVCRDAEVPLVVGDLYPSGFGNIAECCLDVGMALTECSEVAGIK